MKTAVSLPDELFVSAEALAKRLGLSRSRLIATALADFIAKHRGSRITHQLDKIYSHVDSRLDASLRDLQARSLRRDEW
ncbi:MAG: hypothetical protein HYT87_05105 [Nitrospirae bacterium]|nr:hypothetical protein [Nitrospirota bacterium]